MQDGDLPRSIEMQGASNVRDIGGWPTADGRRVRFGRVFRSASLAGITHDDQATLDALGLRTVCDLRGTAERARAPSALDRLPHVVIQSLPIEPSLGASLRDILATRAATGEDVGGLMRRAYTAYALNWGHRYRAMFELLLDPTAHAVLIHCSAGKDRTGFAAALLLTSLGVGRADVERDYVATNRLWKGDSELGAMVPPEVGAELLRVHSGYLDAAFAAIDTEFGSFGRYGQAVLGMPAARIADLKTLLLE